MAWHFGVRSDTAQRPGDMHAMGTVREFEYFLNDADGRAARAALDLVLWPQGASEAAHGPR